MHDGAHDRTTVRRVGTGTDHETMPMADVVFVHGLGGDDISTWTPEGSSESWLEWLGQDIPSVAVWSVRYPAGLTKWTTAGEGMALPDRATGLIQTLLYYEIGSRPVVFVCHSLGGLVVKQILRQSCEMAKPEWETIARSTLGVAFLATPHSGSNLASIARALPLSRPTRTLLALTAHCPHLKDLGDWYRQNAARLEIRTTAYAESRKIRRGARLVTVVNTTSANPGIEGCITTSVDADHVDICKPANREADTYRGVETFIRQQLARVSAATGAAVPAPETVATKRFATDGDTGTVQPLPELVKQIRELQTLGELDFLTPSEVKMLTFRIIKRRYGVDVD